MDRGNGVVLEPVPPGPVVRKGPPIPPLSPPLVHCDNEGF